MTSKRKKERVWSTCRFVRILPRGCIARYDHHLFLSDLILCSPIRALNAIINAKRKERNQFHIVPNILLLFSRQSFLIGSLALLPSLPTWQHLEHTHTRTFHRLLLYIHMPLRLIISANRRHKLAPLWFSLVSLLFSSPSRISLAQTLNVDEKQNRSRMSWRFGRRCVLHRSTDGSCGSWRTSGWRRKWDSIRWSSPRTARETFARGRERWSPESSDRSMRHLWSTKRAPHERRRRRTWSSSR